MTHGEAIEAAKVVKRSPFVIHTFWALGMADPFPDESTIMEPDNAFNDAKLSFSLEKLVYPPGRYIAD